MRVCDSMAAAMAAAGVQTTFSLLGEGVLWVADCLVQDFGVELVPAWSDNLAVAMADGYARSTSRLGIAALTLGPGLSSAMTSLIVAHKHGTPLLLLVGAPPTTPGFHNQRVDQRALVEAAGLPYVEIESAESAAPMTRHCIARATGERRPVVLALPGDLQCASVSGPVGEEPAISAAKAPHAASCPDPMQVQHLAGLLDRAERPLLIAGSGAVRADALTDIAALADRTGGLLGTSLRALGGFAGHPASVGIVGGFSDDDVRDRLADADLVVALGARFGHYTSSWGQIAPGATVVRVLDHRPELIDESPARGEVVVGDVGLVVRELLGATKDRARSEGWEVPTPRAWQASEPDTLHSYTATRVLSRELAADARLVLGVGHFWSIVATSLEGIAPSRLVFEDDFTAIGQAAAMAVGVSAGNPGDPVYVVDGDGSMQFNPAALRTLAEKQLPVCLVILNDAAYSAEVHALEADGRPGGIATYSPVAFAELAQAYGIHGVRCDTETQYVDALRAFAAGPAPVLLDVRVDPDVISRTYRRTRYGERV